MQDTQFIITILCSNNYSKTWCLETATPLPSPPLHSPWAELTVPECMHANVCECVWVKQRTDPLWVEILHSLGYGAEHSRGLSLREALVVQDTVEQLASTHQFHNQIHKLPIIVDLQATTHTALLWKWAIFNLSFFFFLTILETILQWYTRYNNYICPIRIITMYFITSSRIFGVFSSSWVKQWSILVKLHVFNSVIEMYNLV